MSVIISNIECNYEVFLWVPFLLFICVVSICTLFNLIKMQGAELLKPYCCAGEQGPQLFTSTAQTCPGLTGVS